MTFANKIVRIETVSKGGTIDEKRFVEYPTTIPANQFALSPGTQIDYISFDQVSFEVSQLMSYIAYNDFAEDLNWNFSDPIAKCLDDLTSFSSKHQELLKNNQFLASKITNYYEFLNNQKQKFQESPAIVYSKK